MGAVTFIVLTTSQREKEREKTLSLFEVKGRQEGAHSLLKLEILVVCARFGLLLHCCSPFFKKSVPTPVLTFCFDFPPFYTELYVVVDFDLILLEEQSQGSKDLRDWARLQKRRRRIFSFVE